MKENSNTEWKESVSNSFLKTVSAFANYHGGSIIFGVSDDGTIRGLADPGAACLDIENKTNDCLDPKPPFSLDVDERRKIITMTVREGEDKPYLYKGKAYRRADTATVEVDGVELRRLVLAGKNLNFEQLPSARTDLTFDVLDKRLASERVVEALNGDVLRTLNLFSTDKGYNNAALIVSDQNTFPGIDVAKFGDSINVIADRALFEGVSVIQQIDLACEMFERYYCVEIIDGIARRKHYSVPLDAFREAIANAIAHRAWDVNTKIRVAMHPDRIEIFSPGGLPSNLTEDEYQRGFISELRNPILAGVLFRLNIIEMFGTGITRIRKAYSAFDQKPHFEATANAVHVTLPVVESRKALTANEARAYEFLRIRQQAPSSEIAQELGFGKDKTIAILRSLVDKQYIEKTGKGRGTKYQV